MMLHVSISLASGRRGYRKLGPFSATVVLNSSASIVVTAWQSITETRKTKGCGGPHSGLPLPWRHNNLPSVGTEGVPIGLDPNPGQKITLTLLLFGMFTKATKGVELSFSRSREWLGEAKKSKIDFAWFLRASYPAL